MSRFSLVSRFSKLLTPVLLLAIAGAAQASTYYVGSLGNDGYSGGSPLNPYLTIQHAINAANSGDTIFVLADTYTGTGNKDLDFGGKNLTLEALPYYGAATTVTIDCQGSGRGFYFHNSESPAAVVDSFNVINGNLGSSGYGAGAYLIGSSPTFIDCTLASGKAYVGGAVYMYSCSPTFTGATFSKNTATWGGAVYQDAYSYPIFSHSKFTTNKASAYGGAVSAYHGNATYNNDTFTANTANYGGACYNDYNCYPSFYGGTFSGNKATYYGGAFYNYDNASPSLFNTVISGNSATYGGAFFNSNTCSPAFVNATITGNKATTQGGAIYNDTNSSPYFDWSILWGNKVGLTDNEIYDADTTSVPYLYVTDIQGGWSGGGYGVLNTDPKFVSTTDFHLQSISPLIDAGDAYGDTIDDNDGNPRVANSYTDLGAYERALPTAINDSYSMYANTTLTVSAANGVLANDLANKGGTLSTVLVN